MRYDGGHKHDRYITQALDRFFDSVPVCPEAESGLGTPREAMHLVGDIDNARLVTDKSGIDHADVMRSWALERLHELEREDLCGFIFKKDSPSSGLYRVKVNKKTEQPVKSGRGLFAAAFTTRFPLTPVEEKGRLHDSILRENFNERVFALKRWRETLAGKRSLGTLVPYLALQTYLTPHPLDLRLRNHV